MLAAMAAMFATPAVAENWKLSGTASATETYTNNVNYAPSDVAVSDFVTSLSAVLNIDGEGRRVQLRGFIGVTELIYARETQNNSFAPQASLFGLVEAIEKFAYVEAQAYVTQTFQSPFGAQPVDLVNATQNRYTQQNYAVSPYIKGVLGSSNIAYQVRDDNYWTTASNFGDFTNALPNTYTNQLTASANSTVKPLGWTLEYIRTYYDNGLSGVATAGNTFTTQIGRLILPYQVDPQTEIAPRIGYEDNDFPLQSSQGVVYGIGGQWSPSDRTHLSGYWEHRFFGSSYLVNFTHRLPNSAINANFSRGISTYPQQAFFIPAGASVSQFLDSAFATRIPDPAEREQAVSQFLAQTGLPPTLTSPLSIYSPNVTLAENATVSMVMIGARNSLTFSLFYLKSQAISGAGTPLPPALQVGQAYTQKGAGVHFNRRLSGYANLQASAVYTSDVNNAETALQGLRTNTGYASLALSSRLGPKTTWSAGVSYTRTDFPGNQDSQDVSTANAFVGISHTF